MHNNTTVLRNAFNINNLIYIAPAFRMTSEVLKIRELGDWTEDLWFTRPTPYHLATEPQDVHIFGVSSHSDKLNEKVEAGYMYLIIQTPV